MTSSFFHVNSEESVSTSNVLLVQQYLLNVYPAGYSTKGTPVSSPKPPGSGVAS